MFVQRILNAGCVNLQTVVSYASLRSIRALQLEAPDDFGLPAHLRHQAVVHFALAPAAYVLGLAVRKIFFPPGQERKGRDAMAARGKLFDTGADDPVTMCTVEIAPPPACLSVSSLHAFGVPTWQSLMQKTHCPGWKCAMPSFSESPTASCDQSSRPPDTFENNISPKPPAMRSSQRRLSREK